MSIRLERRVLELEETVRLMAERLDKLEGKRFQTVSPETSRVCLWCGVDIQHKRPQARYCGDTCRSKAHEAAKTAPAAAHSAC